MAFPKSYPHYFYTELETIIVDGIKEPREKVFNLRVLLEDFLKHGTQSGNIHLQDNLARMNVLQQRYSLPTDLKDRMHDLRKFANAILHEKNVSCTENQALQCGKILFDLAKFLFPDEQPPKPLSELLDPLPEGELQTAFIPKNKKKEVYAVSLIIRKIGEIRENKNGVPFFEVEGETDLPGFFHHKAVKIILTNVQDQSGATPYGGHFTDMHLILEEYQRILFFHLSRNEEDAPIFFSTSKTFFVIEPDNLISVTDISNAVTIYGTYMPSLDLLKKLEESNGSFAMVVGNMVNEVLDRRVRDPQESSEKIFEEIICHQALILRALLKKDQKNTIQLRMELKDALARHEGNINQFVKDHQTDFQPTIEPTFYSPRFGLQGRADILMTSKSNQNDFRIYELKSGKPPHLNYPNHCHQTQISCYEMIAKTVMQKNSSFSAVFYSAASVQEYPIRQVITYAATEQNIIRLRNHLVHSYMRLAQYDLSPLQELFTLDPRDLGNLYAPKRDKLQNAMTHATPEVRAYFETYLCFSAREHHISKLGGTTNRYQKGFAGLWRDNLPDKTEDFSILYGYSICFNHADTDLNLGHFYLEPKDDTSFKQANFREGDIVVLYPVNLETRELNPTKNMILKGYLKEMHENGVLVSIRNKQVSDDFFVKYTHWAIEHDYMESGYLKMYESLAVFLYHENERKKRLILGLERPLFRDEKFAPPRLLSDSQNLLFQQALNARDYFLIQGPPGTGKTSTLLRSITEYLYFNTEEKILLLAFTNRAVDEISHKLRDAKISFFRLGSGNDNQEDTLRSISQNRNFEELLSYFDSIRVFVTTVSSYLTNRNNLSDIRFDTAIIDEASQLLEPHLAGILPQAERFILIGDEKQLPAIVTQSQETNRQVPDLLRVIGFNDLGTSLFERLLNTCKRNGWHDAYGMLKEHFRMHEDISDFVSKQYYDGVLVAQRSEQKTPIQLFNQHSENKLERILAQSRIIFIDVPADAVRSSKQSVEEAQLIARLFDLSMRRLYEQNAVFEPQDFIGIITPFRAQIAVIRELLPPMMLLGNRKFDDLRQKITIDTVERYQGSERDVILVSLVVKDPFLASNICSLMDDNITDRKLNVTLSRAKSHVILCGDAKTLAQVPSYQSFLDYCKEKGSYVKADELD